MRLILISKQTDQGAKLRWCVSNLYYPSLHICKLLHEFFVFVCFSLFAIGLVLPHSPDTNCGRQYYHLCVASVFERCKIRPQRGVWKGCQLQPRNHWSVELRLVCYNMHPSQDEEEEGCEKNRDAAAKEKVFPQGSMYGSPQRWTGGIHGYCEAWRECIEVVQWDTVDGVTG